MEIVCLLKKNIVLYAIKIKLLDLNIVENVIVVLHYMIIIVHGYLLTYILRQVIV